MKGKTLFLAWIMAFIVPAALFTVMDKWLMQNKPLDVSTEPTGATGSTLLPEMQHKMVIWVLQQDGSMEKMEIESYITGVVLAEMPAAFDTEALKAQAVVARTYTLKRSTTGQKHFLGAVCTDSTCCQAYCSVNNFLSSGGSPQDAEKVRRAVEQTAGQTLFYDNTYIEATYFSCSGGRTETALAVWGEDFPYLQAVDSPGEEYAIHYNDSVKFTKADFAKHLNLSVAELTGDWLGSITFTEGGGVDTIKIAGKSFRGTEVRKLLSLRSTVFTILPQGESVCITTKGFGHRVGMSQYGAEAMAVRGEDYREILNHYYPGTELKNCADN